MTAQISAKGTGEVVEPDDEAEEMLRRFVAFVERGTKGGGHIVLRPRPREGCWQPSCELELVYFDREAYRALVDFLRARKTLLTTGTVPSPELLAHRLMLDGDDLDVADVAVPLHRDLHVVAHTVGAGATRLPEAPRRLKDEHIVDLLTKITRERRATDTGGPALRALVFTSRGADAKRFAEAAVQGFRRSNVSSRVEQARADGARVLTGHGLEGDDNRAVDVELVVDHLRSTASRAVDRDFHLVVIVGSGLPGFHERLPVADGLHAETGRWVEPLDLALDDRRRSVVQAALRHAGIGTGPRVVVLVNDLAPADLPELSSRTESIIPYYADSDDDEMGADAQVEILAHVVAERLESK
ncbi:MAG: hypothetical protein CMN30_33965 [Sandaracinus sp.]|nr:hypothetical protein [Sandaracinus sp.]|tara:strand:+ start:601 stop:1671 length:1071 start_codon:yes stop_codon:yes gene_type:complete